MIGDTDVLGLLHPIVHDQLTSCNAVEPSPTMDHHVEPQAHNEATYQCRGPILAARGAAGIPHLVCFGRTLYRFVWCSRDFTLLRGGLLHDQDTVLLIIKLAPLILYDLPFEFI